MAVKVRVRELDYGCEYAFGFFREEGDKTFIFTSAGKWEELQTGVEVDTREKITFRIPRGEAQGEVLQQLANILMAMGYKPEKMKIAAQELERVENHLLDTIAIRDRLLVIIERQQGIDQKGAQA